LPPRLEIKKQVAAVARPAGGKAAADKAAAAAAATKPAEAPKPVKKPQVETGMDEFK
jgi:hypothetical protein